MAEQKHTPGPWDLGGKVKLSNTHLVRYVRFNSEIVCQCWSTGVDRALPVSQREQEMDANARLIAAAPDMLEALKGTLALAEAYYRTLPDDGPEQDHYMTSIIEPARAAIAKAEGK
jgi:hypothetical protein